MEDIVGKAVLLCLALSALMFLGALALWWRPRWYLLQHVGDPAKTWHPARLWGMKDCAPLCFYVYRAWGPFPDEASARSKATEQPSQKSR